MVKKQGYTRWQATYYAWERCKIHSKILSDNPKIRDMLVGVGEDRRGNVRANVKVIEVARKCKTDGSGAQV